MLGVTRPRSVSRISYVDIRQLDETLDSLKLRRYSVPNDGNSFYHAISHQLQLLGKDIPGQTIRRKCVTFLRSRDKIGDVLWERAIESDDETKEEYLLRHSRDGELSDDIIIQAAAEVLHYNIMVVSSEETLKVETFGTSMGEIHIGKVNGDNYVSLEGEARMEESHLPRLFNLRDLVSTRGILKSKSPDHAVPGSHKIAITVEENAVYNQGDREDDEDEPKPSTGSGKPGLNPLDDYDDMFPQIGEEEALLEKPPYDQYICEPPEDDRRTVTATIKFFTKALKCLSYFIFGGLVLGGAMTSKASLMILVNSAKPYRGDATSEFELADFDVMRVWSYIILLTMMLIPEVITMLYSVYRIIMKPQTRVELHTLLWGLVWEVLHAIGEAILVLKVFPYLDATYALLMMPLVAIVPIALHVRAKYLSVIDHKSKSYQKSKNYQRRKNLALAIVALILQLCGFASLFAGFFVPTANSCERKTVCDSTSFWFCFLCPNYTYLWACVGIILTSLRYWENFVTSTLEIPKMFKIRARKLHNKMDNSRFQVSLVYSFVKCLILVGMTFLIFVVVESDTYVSQQVLGRNNEVESYSGERYYRIMQLFNYDGGRSRARNRQSILGHLWGVLAVQTSGAFATFFFGRVACMTMAQKESFSFPLMLVTPAVSAVSAALGIFKQTYNGDQGLLRFFNLAEQYRDIRGISYYLDWNNVLFGPENGVNGQIESRYLGEASFLVIVGLIFGAVGILLVTHYLWHNPFNRLERMEVLFVKPLYGGPMIDQTMLLNRRQYEQEYSKAKQKKDEEEMKRQEKREKERRSSSNNSSRRRKSSRRATISRNHKFVPQLFLCATLWHETEEEMTQILTSLMRLDRDQGSRRVNAQDDEDYYNFQVHILFDDAMEKTSDGTEVTTNKWVHQLCNLIPLAANKVELGKGYDLPPPVIYPTPYGGRLEFVMPHGNLMVVHLKDKQKIRHRKRWSQCMYMYYILGYLQATKKAYKLEDVFLLALDGDVDFQPNAVLLLLDRMKRNPDVGAACGRIHPTGTGPVVWFQKFEYAVGHWLQKTAEHVLGCVLCSPGCFSLFRGLALVDVNVVNMYTTKATEARHFVQWDQGEDRWLCTLLLKQGWRIEYSAASDSFTFAPEDFKEFYNQRRRWGPSTMANIFDILLDAKRAVGNNVYISWGYITYQLGLMISSLLGPATVIMIVQGAYQYVFGWSAAVALIVSLIPVIIFIILCYVTSADTQVAVAAILTIFYALVMMAVVVGVIGSMATNGLLDPNNLFMIMLVGLYAFTGLVHPQELTCLLHGLLYYLCVPSAFIFLMVYSLTNMNNVSWGTRESKPLPGQGESSSEQALEKVAAQNKKAKKMQIGPGGSIYDSPESADGYYSCGLGNLCQCALCIAEKPPQPAENRGTIMHQPSRRATQHVASQRRATLGPQARHSMYKRFSMAKAQQLVTGAEEKQRQLETQAQIEKSLEKRMSLAQLRRISTKIGPDALNTATLRKLSSQRRRLSRRSLEQTDPDAVPHSMSEKSKMLSEQLLQDQQEEFDYYDDIEDDYEDSVNAERMEDEEDEMLYWLVDESMMDGVIEYLDDDERDFWKYIIQEYLYPLDEDKAEKARIKENLKTLRNQVTGAYFLLNALWLILNFALQLTITDIAISFYISGNLVSVNPVSFAFLIFFLIILVIQFSCMLLHRWSTTLHLLSVTNLKWKDSRMDGIRNVKQNEIEKADELQKFKKRNRPNGQVFKAVQDPTDRTSSGANFSFQNRKSSGPYDNPGFVGDPEDITEETSFTDSETRDENLYEKIEVHNTPFNKNPASVKFGSVSKNYLGPAPLPVRKNSDNIDLAMFDANQSRKQAEAVKKEAKTSVFSSPAIEDLIDEKIKVQLNNEVETKPKQGVHFGPLPNSDENDEDQNTQC